MRRIGILRHSFMSNRWPMSQFKRRIRVSVQRHFQRGQQHCRVHGSRNRWILNGTQTNGGILLQIQTRWNFRNFVNESLYELPEALDGSWHSVSLNLPGNFRQFLVERIGSAGRANYIGWKRNGNVHGPLVGGETSAGRNDHYLSSRRWIF